MLLKSKGKIIGIPVPHHHGNLSCFQTGGFQQGFCFLNTLTHNIFVTSFFRYSLKQAGEIIRRDVKRSRYISYCVSSSVKYWEI